MHDWNVVITAHEKGYILSRELLEEMNLGPFERTNFYNVIVMKVDGLQLLLDRMEETLRQSPSVFLLCDFPPRARAACVQFPISRRVREQGP
jgi:hypothetical protein